MRKKFRNMFLVGLLLIAGGGGLGLVGSVMVGNQLLAPTLRRLPSPPQTLNLEPVEFPTVSGSLVRGWYGEPAHANACILLLHGVRSDRTEMLSRAEFLLREGYAVLLFDFQAHGESPGDAITFGFREAYDVDAAVAFIQMQTPAMPLGAIGFSLGGAAALLSSAASEFDFLIVEAVYPTIDTAIANRLRMRFGQPGVWLTPLLTWQLQWRLQISPQQLAPLAAIPRITCPILVIGGSADQHTRREDTQQLFRAASEPKALWILPGAPHGNFHQQFPEAYEPRIRNFIAQALQCP